MKKILFLILALIIAASFYLSNPALADQKIAQFWWHSACDKPVAVTVGKVDPKFNLSKEEFLTDIKQATGIWGNAYGQPLFTIDPQADLKINLVYDERQGLTTQINKLENNLNQDKNSLSPEIAEFQKRVQAFKDRLQKLNQDIDYWNKQGGAPPDVYDRLTKERQEVQKQADSLNAGAAKLKLATENYNAKVGELNSTVQNFNQAIEQKPEEGLYDPATNRIDIYFNINQKELVHTLTHELGHSLGINHNQNPKSIMYPKTNQQLALSPDDVAALKQVCKKHSVPELFSERLSLTFHYYKTSLGVK